ncbi:unnamed protein product [Lepeophtheirus salmonis]|uniref:(salmon louse) hypothetical protein n=1 Tax=Lepeophtheirus salmonis TaxID=72036 RepID=A0A7R8H9H2_LEPSM|nr:unnamed protein product [Lepeophtheirus salmonis]CAF2949503.1 unnamed protein product [Lepeophtheirus salmonis]
MSQPESDEGLEEKASEVTLTDLHNVLTTTTNDDEDHSICGLPPNIDVQPHTLNLIASNEVDKWLLSNPDSRTVYSSTTENVQHCERRPATPLLLQSTWKRLLQTLEILMAKTLEVKNGLLKMTNELPDIIVKAIKSRFAATLDSKDALLCAVSLPNYMSEEPPAQLSYPHPAAAAPSEDYFFSFDAQLHYSNAPMSVETEVINYLISPPVMESLHQFPRVKNVAPQYNATTSSSVPVQRLFSLGGLLVTRNLGDECF